MAFISTNINFLPNIPQKTNTNKIVFIFNSQQTFSIVFLFFFLRDIDQGVYIRTYKGHEGYVNCVCLMNDKYLFSGSGDKTLKCWNVQTGKVIYSVLKILTKLIFNF